MKFKYCVGVDEVGRGPLAGPMTFAALCLPKNFNMPQTGFQIKDSKKMSEPRRKEIFRILSDLKRAGKIDFSISHIKNTLIDKYGITKCAKKGIERCLKKLEIEPDRSKVLLDGLLFAPMEFRNQKTIIKGDEKVKVIALASIIAKVSRDRLMHNLDKKFQFYGFADHKGYGTRAHQEAIKKYGPASMHRLSFLKSRADNEKSSK